MSTPAAVDRTHQHTAFVFLLIRLYSETTLLSCNVLSQVLALNSTDCCNSLPHVILTTQKVHLPRALSVASSDCVCFEFVWVLCILKCVYLFASACVKLAGTVKENFKGLLKILRLLFSLFSFSHSSSFISLEPIILTSLPWCKTVELCKHQTKYIDTWIENWIEDSQ